MKPLSSHQFCRVTILLFAISSAVALAQAPPVSAPPIEPFSELNLPVPDDESTVDATPILEPFGANLFRGRFTTAREDGLNPDYLLQQGDRISLRIWGAISVIETVVVDPQGNIFIPNVGPVSVVGIRNASLNNHIEQAIRRVFRENVNVYTSLDAVTPVSTFVTGFVNNPGSYAGLASDSLLYFLDQAGGIDPMRGSYRRIRILRQGKTIEEVDLYDFLVRGNIPRPQFTDGDTIVVERRGASITVAGAARNTYLFEIPDYGMTGDDLVHLARPHADAHFAAFTGTRHGVPFSKYVPITELATQDIRDGDEIVFTVDQVRETIFIQVAGSHIGQSRFVVPRDTRLSEVLDYIKVDPNLADIDAISLRRDSVKQRQKKSIEEALIRLETAVLSKRSLTREGAEVQIREAGLIESFVRRARRIEPQGILVVATNGAITDVLLQPDDIIVIPEKTNIVQVSGEVSVPQAIVHVEGASLADYIDRVGGYTSRADEQKHLILRRTGEVVPLLNGSTGIRIRPGDEIIALPAVPSNTAEIVQLVTETIFRVASAAAIFIAL